MAEEPRLMTRSEVAAYCSFSTGQFSRLVSAGILPPAVPGMHRWDRKALDICLDKLSGIPDANAPEMHLTTGSGSTMPEGNEEALRLYPPGPNFRTRSPPRSQSSGSNHLNGTPDPTCSTGIIVIPAPWLPA